MLLSLEHFDSYIRGRSSKQLKKYMRVYDDRPETLERDFHRIRIGSSPDVRRRVLSVLKNLNIPKERRKDFHTGMTVYELLELLAQDGHPQVNYLLDLIDEKSRPSKWLLGLCGGILAGLIIYLLTLPPFQFVIDGITYILTSATGIPIVGLVFNVFLSAYYFFDIYINNRQSDFNRWRDAFFLLVSTAANFTAYAILIATAAAASPVVGGLYVAAAGIDALKEAFCLLQEYFQYLTSPPIDEHNQLSLHRAQVRRDFGFEKRRNAFGINLAAALLIAGITAIWCFLPGGIPATILAFAAIGVVYLIKFALLKWNEERLRDKLQKQLVEVEQNYVNLSESPQNEPVLIEKPRYKPGALYSTTPIPQPTPERPGPLRRRERSDNAVSKPAAARRLSFFPERDQKASDEPRLYISTPQ